MIGILIGTLGGFFALFSIPLIFVDGAVSGENVLFIDIKNNCSTKVQLSDDFTLRDCITIKQSVQTMMWIIVAGGTGALGTGIIIEKRQR